MIDLDAASEPGTCRDCGRHTLVNPDGYCDGCQELLDAEDAREAGR